MSEPENKDPFQPWNDGMHKDDPFAPWNDETKRDDPFACWNNPFGDGDYKDEVDRYTGRRERRY